MHDAMQIHWTKFANKPQWAMWVLFAALHEQGTSLGGIMFDDIGPQHRQGTAMFNDSFIKNAPAGDPAPAAWVARMKFWTAVHEMGHAFNLAHSWQKALVYQGNGPWIPLANEPNARSFMNYPYNVPGGQAAFFANFEFRFSNGRAAVHAPRAAAVRADGQPGLVRPSRFRARRSRSQHVQNYTLELRTHRHQLDYFEFLELVKAELKLTNTSGQAMLINRSVLENGDGMQVIVRRSRTAWPRWWLHSRGIAAAAIKSRRRTGRVPLRAVGPVHGCGWIHPVRAGRLHGSSGRSTVDGEQVVSNEDHEFGSPRRAVSKNR